MVEKHPRVRAYVKNQGLGLEVPYQMGSTSRRYLPDFILLVDDGRMNEQGQPDPLRLVVEIKGYRGEDAKEKKATMETYWVPGVNRLESFGRWAFAEFTDVYALGDNLESEITASLNELVARAGANGPVASATAREGKSGWQKDGNHSRSSHLTHEAAGRPNIPRGAPAAAEG